LYLLRVGDVLADFALVRADAGKHFLLVIIIIVVVNLNNDKLGFKSQRNN
jgi:hypothetical protein